MPKYVLAYANKTDVPSELQQYWNETTKQVIIYAGDNVAGELNVELDRKNKELLGEKKTLQSQYDGLLTSSSGLSKRVQELQVEITQLTANSGITATDKAILDAVKKAKVEKPEDVEKYLTEYPTLLEKTNQATKAEKDRQLFKLSGFGNETVFQTVINTPSLNPNLVGFEVATNEGKEVIVAKVKNQDGTEKTESWSDYIKNNPNWNAFMPSLQQTNDNSTSWVNQDKGENNTGNVNQNNAPNPLLGALQQSLKPKTDAKAS